MLVVNTKRYKKKYAIGGSGIFDTIISFGKKLLSSDGAKKAATALASSAAKQAGKHIVDRMLQPKPLPEQTYQPAPVYQTSQLTPQSRQDLTNLIQASPNTGSAIKIQDLVKTRGKGMKITR
jgi:hypothetical protein